MKKYLALLCVFISVASIDAKRKVFAHSFMYTKPGYYDVPMEQALWHDIAYNKKGPHRAGFQIIPFFQESMPLRKNAQYFLINGKTELLVAGDEVIEDLEIRDIRAEWLGLPNNFRGFLSVNPKQKQFGASLEYHQDLKQWFDIPVLRDMYITAVLPIVHVKNDINFRQCDVTNRNTTFPQDILQAFNQPDWCFSRIPTESQSKTGVAELRLRIGTCYVSEEYLQLNYYTVLAIPTGNKQNDKFMFQPVNGNNHHLGIGGGLNMQFPLNRDTTDHAICFFIDLESVILIRNKQFRTYDLFEKPWSRFLLMNTIGAGSNQPGVNFMTQKITAKPFNVVDFAAGWRFHAARFECEIGYGIWGHGNERTNLKQPAPFHIVGKVGEDGKVPQIPVVTDQPIAFGIAGSAPGKTASKSTIAFQAPDDEEFVPITTSDFNPQSGESFGGFNQRFIAALGFINKGRVNDTLVGLGFSVDVPFHNSLLQLWKAWVKIGATF